MEEETITIEIRQEVAVMLVFLVVGIVLVCAAYSIPGKTAELWPALSAGGIASATYLIALLVFILRKPLGWKVRLLTVLASVIVLGTTAYSWILMENYGMWRKERLLEVRGLIGSGIRETKSSDCLLRTLDAYYRQGEHRRESLAEIFKNQNNGAVIGSNVHPAEYAGDEIRIFVEQLETDRIVLISQETFIKGMNPEFKNYDGKTGMVQDAYVLTAKGLEHESQN
jgi:hypothetical protein